MKLWNINFYKINKEYTFIGKMQNYCRNAFFGHVDKLCELQTGHK